MKEKKKTCDERIYCRYVKRTLDFIFALILIFFTLLPMFVIAVIIRSESSGNAFFKQKRMGLGGRIFICYKFRTMYQNAPKSVPTGSFCDASLYVTPIGRLLRRTSLDELPQLFNVIMGDMSLVGPRPLIENEGEIHELRRRCGVYEVRPGITGLAQIRGRDSIDDIQKARLDVRYVRKMSFAEDARILLNTATVAVLGRDVAF